MFKLPNELLDLHGNGSLRDIDIAFADLVCRMEGQAELNVLLGAALASRTLGDGHICLDLERFAGKDFPDESADETVPAPEAGAGTTVKQVRLPVLKEWTASLRAASAAVALCNGNRTERKPLVLDAKGRLYLHRYWAHEQQVARRLLDLAKTVSDASAELNARIKKLLDASAEEGGDEQRRACRLGLTRTLAIISGGPGTGKTYTVARLAALLLETNPKTRIRLAAPTGKAANRMVESIREAKAFLPVGAVSEEARKEIPEKAETLHRLLGAPASGRVFRRNRDNPIEANVVIVDEASMIALPMMAHLLDALAPGTRLVLVGDMGQLASVEPGSVLGDICRAAASEAPSWNTPNAGHKSPGAKARDPKLGQTKEAVLGDCLVALRYSRRFPPEHAVARLSVAVTTATDEAGADRAWKSLVSSASGGIHLRETDASMPLVDGQRHPVRELRKLVWDGYRDLVNAEKPEEAFAAFSRFRILCSHRSGPYGVEALNQLVERILSLDWIRDPKAHMADPEVKAKRLLDPKGSFYERQAIMITRNDYELNLFNGDMGVILKNEGDQLVGCFEGLDDPIPVSLLPPCETAFATTIHKAQGSEFANLLIVLPPKHTPLLSKELLYTALTRVKPDPKRPADTGVIHLWCTENVFKSATLQATERASGLCDALQS